MGDIKMQNQHKVHSSLFLFIFLFFFKQEGVDIVYLKNIPGQEAPPITISDFKAGMRTISFSLVNYKRVKFEKELQGIAEVKITIFDEKSNKVFDEGKMLNLVKEETHISLNLSKLKSGRHFIIIQAADKISNNIDVYSGNIIL